MKKYFISCSILFLSISIYSKTTVERANFEYISGNFYKAVQLYKKAIIEEGESSAIYYNLGNTYYRLNQIAYAILYYERSILITPSNKDAWFNLRLAKLKTIDKESINSSIFSKCIQSIQNRYSIFQWSIIGISCFIIFTIYLIIFYFFHKKIGFYFGLCCFFFCILSNIFAYKKKESRLTRQNAIIIELSTFIKSAPDCSGKNLFVLHSGSKVKIIDILGKWANIKTLDNQASGWIEKNRMEVI